MRMSLSGGLLVLVALAVAGVCGAEIRLPHMLSEHAVLQRERPIHIWGWSDPGERVEVAFHEQTLQLVGDATGEFSGWLKPERAGGPYTLTVSGGADEAAVRVGDLLVGDVWFASGQSNMEMPLRGFGPGTPVKDGEREIAAATHPEIRLLRFETTASDVPARDVTAVWSRCEPGTAAAFSAVAYFFGREIAEREHVAVGLIDSSWGGTPVDSWISLDALGADASLMPVFRSRARFAEGQADLDRVMAREKSEDAAAKAKGQAVPPPGRAWHPNERSWSPSLLFNGMVAPATAYTVRGFLWYQGETDSSPERSPMYAKLLPTLIEDWRAKWGEGALPFLYVQISSFNSPPEVWGVVRDAQRRTLKLENTAMAVSLDVGLAGNVHPPDKQTVGHRLALGARHLSYGDTAEWSGPMFREVTVERAGVRVWFDHAEGLQARGAVRGFELAGDDGRFVPATGTIEGGTVLVEAQGVSRPKAVRFGWANVTDANLYNGDGLPGSTFLAEVR